MVVDIHSHIERDYRNPKTEEDALLADMEKNGIGKRVVSALDGKSIQEQNSYVSDFVSKYPDKLIGCAMINPKNYGCIEDTKHALSLPSIKMMEFNSFEHGYYPDTCDTIDEILCMVGKKKLAVKIFTGLGARAMPQQWISHVKNHPEVPFLFLHMGCFDYGYGCIDLALQYENLYLETSNQYEIQILKKAVTKLPSNKLVFGSSYPHCFTKCSLDIFDMFELEEEYKRQIFETSYKVFF